MPASFVRSAALQITRLDVPARGYVNGHVTAGYQVVFLARVESDLHANYTVSTTVFVAPHNGELERRSLRRNR
jgi:hypothetical protein